MTPEQLLKKLNDLKISIAWWEDRKLWIASVLIPVTLDVSSYVQGKSPTSPEIAIKDLLGKLGKLDDIS